MKDLPNAANSARENGLPGRDDGAAFLQAAGQTQFGQSVFLIFSKPSFSSSAASFRAVFTSSADTQFGGDGQFPGGIAGSFGDTAGFLLELVQVRFQLFELVFGFGGAQLDLRKRSFQAVIDAP